MELGTYQALACQLVDRVVEAYLFARLDLIAEAGSLFVIQSSYVALNESREMPSPIPSLEDKRGNEKPGRFRIWSRLAFPFEMLARPDTVLRLSLRNRRVVPRIAQEHAEDG